MRKAQDWCFASEKTVELDVMGGRMMTRGLYFN